METPLEMLRNQHKTFKEDLKKAREVMVFAKSTGGFFKITKREVKELAKDTFIRYYMTDAIFKVKRTVMVII